MGGQRRRRAADMPPLLGWSIIIQQRLGGHAVSIRFGPSGNSDSFYAQGYKNTQQMPEYLVAMGLDAFEYSFGRGITLREETARRIGQAAAAQGIAMSVHAPYYINLANPDPEARRKSREYIYRSVDLCGPLGARRVVLHPGARGKGAGEAALPTALEQMHRIAEHVARQNPDVLLCPETMGKRNQLGTLEEVVELCKVADNVLPTLDFGHIYALEQGALITRAQYAQRLDYVQRHLGADKTRRLHIHFSHVQYTQAGELRHLTLEDQSFGPPFEPLAQELVSRALQPVIICESRGRMAEDARLLKHLYQQELARAGAPA